MGMVAPKDANTKVDNVSSHKKKHIPETMSKQIREKTGNAVDCESTKIPDNNHIQFRLILCSSLDRDIIGHLANNNSYKVHISMELYSHNCPAVF